MTSFSGSPEEFKRYFGPYLCKVVQNKTKNHKKNIGACEHCGSNKDLESAHVRGRDRSQIIDTLLPPFMVEGTLSVDLQDFETKFLAEHVPLEKAILVLCKDCHTNYDSSTEDSTISSSADVPEKSITSGSRHTTSDLLPISLDPPNTDEFKKQLLIRKTAEISIKYIDGRVATKTWDASRFLHTSSVMNNLRSRPKFRTGEWQRLGIAAVHVKVS